MALDWGNEHAGINFHKLIHKFWSNKYIEHILLCDFNFYSYYCIIYIALFLWISEKNFYNFIVFAGKYTVCGSTQNKLTFT